MNSTMAPARHLHLDIELDRANQFHYHNHGQDGHRVILHRGDGITFTCCESFCVGFAGRSPLEGQKLASRQDSLVQSREWFVASRVRDDAPHGVYRYTVDVTRDGQVFQDSLELVIESAAG